MKTIPGDRIFVWLSSIVFFSSLAITGVDFYRHWKHGFSFNAISAMGVIALCSGFFLRWYCRLKLGRLYSYGLEIKENHRLVLSGPYRYIRHPIYLAMLVYSPAIPVIFRSPAGFVVMLLMIPLIVYRIKIEEKMLLENFGDEYLQYTRRTWSLLPFIY